MGQCVMWGKWQENSPPASCPALTSLQQLGLSAQAAPQHPWQGDVLQQLAGDAFVCGKRRGRGTPSLRASPAKGEGASCPGTASPRREKVPCSLLQAREKAKEPRNLSCSNPPGFLSP